MKIQKNRPYLPLLLILGLLHAYVPAHAQQERREKFRGQDRFEILLDKINPSEKRSQGPEKKDPFIVADDLANLPNPFLPQLPEETVAEPSISPVPMTTDRAPLPGPPSPDIPAEPAPTYTFTLSGLIWNTDLPQAIVNGRIVKEGDRIDLWTVQKISRQGVELIYKDETMLIKP